MTDQQSQGEAPAGLVRVTGRDALPSLTSLRFFAAAFVVCYHLMRYAGPVTTVSSIAWYGRSGVTFFFVLSGFVLAWTYYDRMPPRRVFWWRRFARIWPLMVVATILSVVAYRAIGTPVSGEEVIGGVLLIHAWSLDPLIVRGGNGATWSLSDEAFFYVCFPFLLALLSRSTRSIRNAMITLLGALVGMAAVWVVVGVSVGGFSMRSSLVDSFPPTRLLQFVVGVAFGVAFGRGWRPRIPLSFAVLVFIAYHIGLTYWRTAVPETSPWGAYSASQLFSTPVYLLIVLAAAGRDLDGRSGFLARPWLIRLGHWSFAWYLVHEIVIRCAIAVGGRPIGLKWTVAFWAGSAIVSQSVAAALYHLVEHPAERRLRKLVEVRDLPVPGSAPSPSKPGT